MTAQSWPGCLPNVPVSSFAYRPLCPSFHSMTSASFSLANILTTAVLPAPAGPDRTRTRRYFASFGLSGLNASENQFSTSASFFGWIERSS